MPASDVEEVVEVLPSDCELFDSVRQLLKAWSLSSYLATRPPSPVVTLSASDTCGQALRTLASYQISAAPVFEGSTCLGFVCAADVLAALLSHINVRELTDETRAYRLRCAGLQLEHQQLRSLCLSQDGALIYRADASSSLHDVVLYGFLQPNAAGHLQVVHRVGVFDAADTDASDEDMEADGAGLQGIRITHVISQSDVVHFLHKHVAELGPLADASLASLGLARKPVVCVPGEMSTVNAFASMVANKVSCVGVISHAAGGGVAASLSSSDLRGLLPEHFVSLATPVLAFLTAKASAGWAAQQKPHLPHMQQQQQQASPLPSPQQSPQYQQPQPQHAPQQQQQQAPQSPLHVAGSAHKWGLKGAEGSKPPPLVSVTPASSLREVLELLALHRLHRLHVLDERRRPVGIVTITNLLRVVVGSSQLLEALPPDLAEQEVEQLQPAEAPDCSMGVDIGQELVEPPRGLLQVSSQALINTAG